MTSCDQEFATFERVMRSLSRSIARDISARGFKSYEYNGMHDPPGKPRVYHEVEKRLNLSVRRKLDTYLVQLEVHKKPTGRRQAAVYVRSERFPRNRKCVANVTFKFAQDAGGNYLVRFSSQNKGASALLTNNRGLPKGIRRSPSAKNVLLLGTRLGAAMVERLLNLATAIGRACAG